MNFYEQLLTLGFDLHSSERIALYKFLMKSKRNRYISDAQELLESTQLTREVADGDISYLLKERMIYFSARRKGVRDFHLDIRSLQISRISKFRSRKMIKFFAQCEVDVITNYPIQTVKADQYTGFSINRYTYFDPRYFANGRSWIWGIIPMLRCKDAQMMQLLRDPNSTGWERHWTSSDEG